MTQNLDQINKPKLPNFDGVKKLRESQSQRRKDNFRAVILWQPIIEFCRSAPWNSDEHDVIGIQWSSGATRSSQIFGYPDQSYW